MKKIIAMLLVLTMAMSLIACGNTGNTETTADTTPDTTATAPVIEDEKAVEVLTAIWDNMDEEKKFFSMGGDMNNIVDGAPGAYSLEDVETLGVQLLVPAEEVTNITEAASLFHGMMLNNFTCGVFKVAEGVDAAAFAETMHNAVATARWMCGMPEKELIAVIGGQYVLMTFGINDAVNPFEAKLTEAYPEATVVYSQAIG